MSIHTRVVNDPLPAKSPWYGMKLVGGPADGEVEWTKKLLVEVYRAGGVYEKSHCEGEFAIYKFTAYIA